MLSKILGLGLFGQQTQNESSPHIQKEEQPEKKRRLLHTRHWRDRKKKGTKAGSATGEIASSSLAKENVPPPLPSRPLERIVDSPKGGAARSPVFLNPPSSSPMDVSNQSLTSLPLSPSATAVSPTTLSSVRRLRIENTNLKAKVSQLEGELESCKLQAAEETAVLKQQIEELKAKLGRRYDMKRAMPIAATALEKGAKSSTSAAKKVQTVAASTSETEKTKKTPKNAAKFAKKKLMLRGKKARTSDHTTASMTVVPLAQHAPPPAPPPAPPAIVVTVGEGVQTTGVEEARKNLKRRASSDADAAAPQRKKEASAQFPPSLNDVLKIRNALKPAASRRETGRKPNTNQAIHDDFKAALLKKFENANVYSPLPPHGETNDSFTFCEPISPYRS